MDKHISKLKKFWIWLWYNDLTRFCLVLFPSYFIVLIPLLIWVGVSESVFRIILSVIYIGVIVWAIIDNDYSNLRKIGMDENRRPIKKKKGRKENDKI